MDREAWRAVIHGVAESWTRLNDWTELNCNFFWKIFLIYFNGRYFFKWSFANFHQGSVDFVLISLSFSGPHSLSKRLILPTPGHSIIRFLQTSGSFPMSQLFTSGGQSFGASASASVIPMNIQGWFPFGLTGLISLQSRGFSRVFSSSTIWKHQFFGTQPSLWSSSHIGT